ncbi:MAG: hypothetical protein MUF81_12975, partial [Verrucomicrobia bacterium]|nr:hypothetical protein [Verrucomicrobiota bacterium]
ARVEEIRQKFPGVAVTTAWQDLAIKPQVAILGLPTRTVIQEAPELLASGICTVDCFDMHGEPFLNLRATLSPVAIANGSVSVMGAGVDPGVSTIMRSLFELWAPTGLTYVTYGPGMSMGHTVAAKSYAGVKDALSITRPGDPGCHKRDLYLEITDGYEFERSFVVFLGHEVVEAAHGCQTWIFAAADPMHGHADYRPADGGQVERRVAVAHTAAVFSGNDVQALVQAVFNSPILAIGLEHLLGIHLGRWSRGNEKLNCGFFGWLARDFNAAGELGGLCGKGKVGPAGADFKSAEAAFFGPPAVDLRGGGAGGCVPRGKMRATDFCGVVSRSSGLRADCL